MKNFISVIEFANFMKMHPESIRRLIRQKKIKGVVRVGHMYKINPKIALQYIQTQKKDKNL